jgi:hypothetical protein
VCLCFDAMYLSDSKKSFSLDFLSLRNALTQLHNSFDARMEKNRQDDSEVPRMVSHDSDDNRNVEMEGMTYHMTDQAIVSFSYLSLFLCRLPTLGLSFAPEVNQRKVEPSQFYDVRDNISMFSALSEGHNAGFDSKRLLVYPYTVSLHNDRDPASSSPLRSVMKTKYRDGVVTLNSTIFQARGVQATRSEYSDFCRLRFLMNMTTKASPNSIKSWDGIFRDNKLSTSEEFENLFRDFDLPNDLQVLNSVGEGEHLRGA